LFPDGSGGFGLTCREFWGPDDGKRLSCGGHTQFLPGKEFRVWARRRILPRAICAWQEEIGVAEFLGERVDSSLSGLGWVVRERALAERRPTLCPIGRLAKISGGENCGRILFRALKPKDFSGGRPGRRPIVSRKRRQVNAGAPASFVVSEEFESDGIAALGRAPPALVALKQPSDVAREHALGAIQVYAVGAGDSFCVCGAADDGRVSADCEW